MRFKTLLLFGIFLTAKIAFSQTTQCVPKQVHLSLGDEYYSVSKFDHLRLPSERFNDNNLYLIFEAQGNCEFSIQINEDKENGTVLNQPISSVELIETPSYNEDKEEQNFEDIIFDDPSFIYTAMFKSLSYGVDYEYTIKDQAGETLAGPFKFKLAGPYHTQTDSVKKIMFIGGLNTLQNDSYLENLESFNEGYSGIVQLGDIQCAEESNCEEFLDKIEPIASRIPVTFTNSHAFLDNKVKNSLADMTHNHYYSFNLEGIHFVFLSFDYYESSAPETQHSMFLWIDNDLRKANDEKHRNLWSWIVVLTDKPIYSTIQDNYSQRQHWDELFKLYNVNIVLSGNQGYYERLAPLYQNTTQGESFSQDIHDASAPVFILEGSGSEYPINEAKGYGRYITEKAGFGTLSVQNNSNYSALSYERYNIQGNKLDHMNLIRFHPQPKPIEKPVESVDIKEEEIYPQGQKDFNIDVKIPEDVIEIEPETKNISLWHVFLLLLVLVSTSAGGLIFLWRRRAKDPELERLKMSSFKSIKVYNPKNEKNIAMVDLVL